jgi:alpha,alpha-trehalase
MTVTELAPPTTEGFGYLPDPTAVGLDALYVNVRYQSEPSTPHSILQTPMNREGFSDGMIPAVSVPYQKHGESLEDTFKRIGEEYDIFTHRDNYAPGLADNDFFKGHFYTPKPKEPLLAEPGESLDQYRLRLRKHYIHSATEDAGWDIGVPQEFSGPGGRYDGHLFQHDSGLLTLGNAVTNRPDLVRKTALNFKALIERGGFIPNATARFYANRGQIPHFAQITELLIDLEGPQVLEEFLPALEQEYAWWMSGDPDEAARDPIGSASNVVRMPDGSILNRYASTSRRPRLEAFKEDLEYATLAASGLTGVARQRRMEAYYAHVAAGAAEGHDFHAGMTSDGVNMHEIEVSNRVQVGLNARLATHEMLLARAYRQRGDTDKANRMQQQINARVASINTYQWNGEEFCDYNFVRGTHAEPDATMTYPLLAGISNRIQDAAVVEAMRAYEQPNGVSFSANSSKNYNWRQDTVWAFTVVEVAGALACAGGRLGGETGRQAKERADGIRTRYVRAVRATFRSMRMTPERLHSQCIDQPAEGGEYDPVPSFAPTVEAVAALEARDPYSGRSVAQIALRN